MNTRLKNMVCDCWFQRLCMADMFCGPTTMPSKMCAPPSSWDKRRCSTSIRLPQYFDSRVTHCVTSQMKKTFSWPNFFIYAVVFPIVICPFTTSVYVCVRVNSIITTFERSDFFSGEKVMKTSTDGIIHLWHQHRSTRVQQSESVCRFLLLIVSYKKWWYIIWDNHCFGCVAFASLCIQLYHFSKTFKKKAHVEKKGIPSTIPNVSATVFCNNYQNLGKTDVGVDQVWTID